MKVKALKTFDGREGFIRAGSEPNLSDGYARELARNGLVELLDPSEPGPAPENKQAKPAAPMRAAATRPGGGKRPGKEPALGDGPVLSPLSSRAVQVQAKKTQKKSAGGAKKTEAETTPPAGDPNAASS
jgi:hypothetical protein